MILVMASTGMFGRPVVEGLARRGLPVRATGRSVRALENLNAPGAELMPADMDDPSTLLRLMEGVDKVLVNAPIDDKKEVRERNVIEAMIHSGHGAKIGGFFDRFQDAAIADQRLLWLFPLVYLVIRGPGLISLDTVFGRMSRREHV